MYFRGEITSPLSDFRHSMKKLFHIFLFIAAAVCCLSSCTLLDVSEQQDAKTLGTGKYSHQFSIPFSPTVAFFEPKDSASAPHHFIPSIIPMEFHVQYGVATHHDIGATVWTGLTPMGVLVGGKGGADIGLRVNWKWMLTDPASHHKLALNTSLSYYRASGGVSTDFGDEPRYSVTSEFIGLALIYSYHPPSRKLESMYFGIKPTVFITQGSMDSLSMSYRGIDTNGRNTNPSQRIDGTMLTFSPFFGMKFTRPVSFLFLENIEFMPTFRFIGGRMHTIGISVALGTSWF